MSALEQCSLFADLSREEIEALSRAARELRFFPGQPVFKEGGPGEGLYVVQSGGVEVSVVVGSGAGCVVSEAGPGDFFGEMAVIDDKPRSATVTAVEQTVVTFIRRDEMLRMLEHSPALSLKLLREISNRLRDFNQRYIDEVLQFERLALVGRFARSIVHDIKNPLNIISLSAELAGQENATPEMRARVQNNIAKQVEKMSDMISEILAFTQGSDDTQVFGTTAYDLFVERLMEEIRAEMDLKGVRIDMENPPPPVQLLLNPKRLGRVFYNLAQNASDAMPEGGTIKVRFAQNNAEVVTEFEDSGTGIAPEVADKLFEAFATFGKAHGTGLGLSICRKIVEDHRGRISARNGAAGGAIFAFSLPMPG